MKNLYFIVLAFLFSCLLLCACGTQEQNAPGTSVPTMSEAVAAGDGAQADASFSPYKLMRFMKCITEMQPATLTPR